MANLNYDFNNRWALVTGGARGIGLEITKQFLTAGASVSVWDYSDESLLEASKELAPYEGKVFFSQVDVGDFESCRSAAEALPQKIDILINNAGITRDKSFSKMSPEQFDEVITTNLKGVFNSTKACLDFFSDNSNKRIISISSVVALYGNFGQTNYVAAKSGVIGMTKTWARELGPKGFTANAVAPGFTRTPMVEAMPQEILDQMAAKIPVRKLGEPEDIARACLYIASEEAGYVNGAVLSVDGGLVV